MRSVRISRTRAACVLLTAVLASAVFAGCDSSSTIAPGSRLDTPWQRMSDLQLMAKIAEAGGRVFIGFKDPGESAGVTETGYVLASPEAVAAGKELIRSLGIEITTEYRYVPSVAARVAPVLLPRIRHNALIEYVEPIFPGTRLQR